MKHSEAQAKYPYHILVCVNQRAANNPKGACGNCQSQQLHISLVNLVKNAGLKAVVKVSKTYCLDACEFGPVVVVYPANRWYLNVNADDLKALFEAEIIKQQAYLPKLATATSWENLKHLRKSQNV